MANLQKERVSKNEQARQEQQQPDQFPFFIPTTSRTIAGSLPGGRRLLHPLTLMVEYDDGEVIVSEPLFHMHAAAPTEIEAIEAFKRIFSG
jgi:hypothetical protein